MKHILIYGLLVVSLGFNAFMVVRNFGARDTRVVATVDTNRQMQDAAEKHRQRMTAYLEAAGTNELRPDEPMSLVAVLLAQGFPKTFVQAIARTHVDEIYKVCYLTPSSLGTPSDVRTRLETKRAQLLAEIDKVN